MVRVNKYPAIGVHKILRVDRCLGSYSRRCTFKKMEYEFTYNSWATINRDGTLTYVDPYGNKYNRIAPKGWKWDIDEWGLKLVHKRIPSLDFHPLGDQIVNYHPKEMTKIAIANAQIRKKKLKEQKQYLESRISQDLQGLNITVEDVLKNATATRKDSYRVGNCQKGTEEFIKKYNIKGDRVPVKTLIDTDHPRAMLVAKEAIYRYVLELKQGYCQIG